jgi:uncharacterized membrane protein
MTNTTREYVGALTTAESIWRMGQVDSMGHPLSYTEIVDAEIGLWRLFIQWSQFQSPVVVELHHENSENGQHWETIFSELSHNGMFGIFTQKDIASYQQQNAHQLNRHLLIHENGLIISKISNKYGVSPTIYLVEGKQSSTNDALFLSFRITFEFTVY